MRLARENPRWAHREVAKLGFRLANDDPSALERRRTRPRRPAPRELRRIDRQRAHARAVCDRPLARPEAAPRDPAVRAGGGTAEGHVRAWMPPSQRIHQDHDDQIVPRSPRCSLRVALEDRPSGALARHARALEQTSCSRRGVAVLAAIEARRDQGEAGMLAAIAVLRRALAAQAAQERSGSRRRDRVAAGAARGCSQSRGGCDRGRRRRAVVALMRRPARARPAGDAGVTEHTAVRSCMRARVNRPFYRRRELLHGIDAPARRTPSPRRAGRARRHGSATRVGGHRARSGRTALPIVSRG